MNNPSYGFWANHCVNLYGHKVNNYRTKQGWRDLSIISDDLKPIMIMLNSLSLSNNKDELVWKDNASGFYMTASRYSTLWSFKETPPWSRAWIPGLTPKVNMFFWLALKGKTLTQENLIKRGHIMPNRCVLCKDQLETRNHMFIHFSFPRIVWGTITQDLGHNCRIPSNLLDFFYQWHALFKGYHVGN